MTKLDKGILTWQIALGGVCVLAGLYVMQLVPIIIGIAVIALSIVTLIFGKRTKYYSWKGYYGDDNNPS